MLTIYCEHITKRTEYIFDVVFNYLIKTPYKITNSKQEFTESNNPKFSYTYEGELNIIPSALLSQSSIKQNIDLTWHNHNNQKWLFKTNGELLPFDVFSSIFYLITRYEEYTANDNAFDEHGRFLLDKSILTNHYQYKKPLAHIWAAELKQKLTDKFPQIQFEERKYSAELTVDVDQLYAYKNRGVINTLAGILKKLSAGKWKQCKTQVNTILQRKNDPFDNFTFFKEISKEVDLKYFIHCGAKAKNDPRFINSNSNKKRIKQLAENSKVYIHPSYKSLRNSKLISIEKEKLELIINKKIEHSRQHYLVAKLPKYYQNLLKTDIKHDYSQGYVLENGFKTGMCIPYPYFDLSNNLKTQLTIHPFHVTDLSILKNEKNLQDVYTIIDQIKAVNGTISILWHSDLFALQNSSEKWKSILLKIVEHATA